MGIRSHTSQRHLALLPLLRPLTAWQILVVDEETAADQMAQDEQLARTGRPVVRFFRWSQPAVSVGYRQRLPEWVDPVRLSVHGVELVERPTGGGLVLHGSDVSCSVTLPLRTGMALRSIMARVCESWALACRVFGICVTWLEDLVSRERIQYCLTEPSPYGLLVGCRKLGGFAIRRYPGSWLIQGSLLVQPFPQLLRTLLPTTVDEALLTQAVSLEEAVGHTIQPEELITAVAEAWRKVWGIPVERS